MTSHFKSYLGDLTNNYMDHCTEYGQLCVQYIRTKYEQLHSICVVGCMAGWQLCG